MISEHAIRVQELARELLPILVSDRMLSADPVDMAFEIAERFYRRSDDKLLDDVFYGLLKEEYDEPGVWEYRVDGVVVKDLRIVAIAVVDGKAVESIKCDVQKDGGV